MDIKKEREAGSKYADPKNYSGLNHGLNFIQQNLHFLIHQADRAKEVFGSDSVEYESILARLTNQFAAYGRGGNFTLEEMRHYDTEHTATMKDVNEMLKEMVGIPLTSYVQGYNWTNVVADLGNADGSGFTPDRNYHMPPARQGERHTPKMYKPGEEPGVGLGPMARPSAYQNKGKPLSDTTPWVGGVQMYSKPMASTARSKKK